MNNMEFQQAATLLAEVNAQVSGNNAGLMAVDSATFTSVAQTTLKAGYDKVIGALSQVLSKTLFSVRPYNRKFKGLAKNEIQFGNHVRKINIGDKDAEVDPSVSVAKPGTTTPDHYKVNAPDVLQTNFYGQSVFMRTLTIFKHQLDQAFTTPEEFMSFVTACVQNVVDQMEKDHENLSRSALLNFIGGLYHVGDMRVINLLSEYNKACGTEYDVKAIRKPENYPAFIKWAMARVRKVSEMMTERSYAFHTNPAGFKLARHTPVEKQKLYILSGDAFDMEAQVLSSVFHDEYLKKVDYETVNFWQNMDNPSAIMVRPSVMEDDGSILALQSDVECTDVFGVLFDEEAIGYTVINQWVATTPLNATGGYSNTAWHYTDRYWNDFTENGVIFVLE